LILWGGGSADLVLQALPVMSIRLHNTTVFTQRVIDSLVFGRNLMWLAAGWDEMRRR